MIDIHLLLASTMLGMITIIGAFVKNFVFQFKMGGKKQLISKAFDHCKDRLSEGGMLVEPSEYLSDEAYDLGDKMFLAIVDVIEETIEEEVDILYQSGDLEDEGDQEEDSEEDPGDRQVNRPGKPKVESLAKPCTPREHQKAASQGEATIGDVYHAAPKVQPARIYTALGFSSCWGDRGMWKSSGRRPTRL